MAKILIGNSTPETACKICSSTQLVPYLDLGLMPKPNGFLSSITDEEPEPFYPLEVAYCKNCYLSQLTHVVPADVMFKNYLYVPSTSTTMRNHFSNLASLLGRLSIQNKLVVDIGSNDGTLLSYCNEHGARTLGIDPASNLAELARSRGVETLDVFFGEDVGKNVATKYGHADVITATNVFAHVHNLHDFCKGVKSLLSENGVFIIEVPYAIDMLENNEFDTIYHEHLSYFTIHALRKLFGKHDMHVTKIQTLPVHGGSIRVFVRHHPDDASCVDGYLETEAEKIFDHSFYEGFANRVQEMRTVARNQLLLLKTAEKRIVGYGAPAKGNIMLNYFGINGEIFDYIVDSIPQKQGLYTPGTHIPIVPEAKLLEDMPHYAVLMAWNFEKEIVEKQKTYLERGGHFVRFIPDLKVI